MTAIESPTDELLHRKNGFSPEERAELDAPEVWPEVDALVEKIHQLTKANEQLREFVKQLSVLVIRNVVERDNCKSVSANTIGRARS